jgi:hypothetical protein
VLLESLPFLTPVPPLFFSELLYDVDAGVLDDVSLGLV